MQSRNEPDVSKFALFPHIYTVDPTMNITQYGLHVLPSIRVRVRVRVDLKLYMIASYSLDPVASYS